MKLVFGAREIKCMYKDKFIRKVLRFIESGSLFGSGSRILVALSGGADSVALLRVLLQAGYACEAAHCNFHLRGEESDRDEEFVRTLAGKLGVTLHVAHFDTERYAAGHRISVEMAARELRYEWFERLRSDIRADVVAVAHHRDDSVETFLLNLVRGTGIDGLRGIRPVNGRIVRPLLGVSREEILDYLLELGQTYVTDSTNLKDEFTRNKLRLDVLPLLESMNPSIRESIVETARRLSDVADVYDAEIRKACARVQTGERRISIPALRSEVSPKAVLYELLYPLGFNSSQIKDIYMCMDGQPGKLFYTDDKVLLCDREELVWKYKEDKEVQPLLHQEIIVCDGAFSVPRVTTEAYLDADFVTMPLMLRKWRSGDRFVPYGMKGFKKVRDYLLDRKFSLFQKEKQYVVCSGDDIVWLVDERTDNRFRVTPTTRRILVLRVEIPTK